MLKWFLELLSSLGKPSRPPEPVITPEDPPSDLSSSESDLSNSGLDDTPDLEEEAATPQILEPRPVKEVFPVYHFSRRSLGILNGIHPKHGVMRPVYPPLAEAVRLAIQFSIVDMTVLSATLRTEEEQRTFVNEGRSKTMNSLHLPQADGFVHAVDIAALEGGTVSWRPDVYFDIAEAMQEAARELDLPIVWGGAWLPLNTYDDAVHDLHADYVQRKRREGKRPFFDGPHFQLKG